MKKLTTILFLFVSTIVSAQSFWGDWESGKVTGTGNKNWGYLEAVAPDRFTLINDGIRPGTYARVEVREGDNPLNCCKGTETCAVYGMRDSDNNRIFENENSGTQQYTFSVKFDTTWQPIIDNNDGNGSWGIFLELHSPDILSTNPALAFSVTDQIRFNSKAGDIVISKYDEYNLSNGLINKGHWIDFILTVKYAKDNTGFVNIMRRDEGQSHFMEVLNVINTPTLQYSSNVNNGAVGGHYWKTGLYRNRTWCTSILYLDGFTRTSCLCK